MSFEIITVALVLIIFSLFAYGAAQAEKAVAAKARLARESHGQPVMKNSKK